MQPTRTAEAAQELLDQLTSDCAMELSEELKAAAATAVLVGFESQPGPSSRGDRIEEGLRRLVRLHPSYPSLVRMFYECKRNICMGKRPMQDLDLEEIAHLAGVKKLKQISGQLRLTAKQTIELGEFMDRQMQAMESLKTELDSCKQSVTKAAEIVDQQLSDVLSCASLLMDLTQIQGQTDPDKTRDPAVNPTTIVGKDSKRKAPHLIQIKDELMRKRKKGKLPPTATEILKDWWEANQSHPYPSEEQKRQLLEDTGLDNAQLNNWFINQRKRHWAPRAISRAHPVGIESLQ